MLIPIKEMNLMLPSLYRVITRWLIGLSLVAISIYEFTGWVIFSWPDTWETFLNTTSLQLAFVILGLAGIGIIWRKPQISSLVGGSLCVLAVISLLGFIFRFLSTTELLLDNLIPSLIYSILNILVAGIAGVGLLLQKNWAWPLLYTWIAGLIALLFYTQFLFWWLIGPL